MAAFSDIAWQVKEGFLDMLYPARCALCDLTGRVLCEACEQSLDYVDASTACPLCAAPFGREQCTECAQVQEIGGFAFTAARAVGSFDEPFSKIIVTYKDAGERRLASSLGRLLAIGAGQDWRIWADAVVFVPAAPSAYHRRGFDHMELVAREFSRHAHLPLMDILIKRETADQRQLDKNGRSANVRGTFSVVEGPLSQALVNKRILLIDDVLTTGATLDAAARALLAGGVDEVRVVVFARVW